ncbi:MAG: hypothetical protein DMF62_02520 [Acidobacteria bacterium]|nr:MAG: hypothetical protein DMF62_02520 [Acidobacteriota bacterium]
MGPPASEVRRRIKDSNKSSAVSGPIGDFTEGCQKAQGVLKSGAFNKARGARLPYGTLPQTERLIREVRLYLRAGKSPKEIAFLIHRTEAAVHKLIQRFDDVRAAYDESFLIRCNHPRTIRRHLLVA